MPRRRRVVALFLLFAIGSPCHSLRTTLDVSNPVSSWLGALGAGVVNDAVEVRQSTACGGGLGVFARRTIAPRELLATIPVSACISAIDARACLGATCGNFLDEDSNRNREGVALAALLVAARYYGLPTARRWGPYIDSLPWSDAVDATAAGNGLDITRPLHGDDDPLWSHTCVIAHRKNDETDVLPGVLEQQRYSASVACQLLCEAAADGALDGAASAVLFRHAKCLEDGVLFDRCLRAIMLVGSRSFDFLWRLQSESPLKTEAAAGRSFVLAPFLDLFNHPSASSLAAAGSAGERWAAAGVQAASIHWTIREGEHDSGCGDDGGLSIHVLGPARLEARKGDELFTYYANAGYGEETEEAGETQHRIFVTSYGFSPWE